MDYGGKDGPPCHSGGVKPLNIEGRFSVQRERLAGGFTDVDRNWRKQFLQDQNLHGEPVTPDWYYKERYNPIRRLYRWPLETLFKVNDPKTGFWGLAGRYWAGKAGVTLLMVYVGYYQLKYHSNDWTNISGFEWIASKKFVPMGHPDHGKKEVLKHADYYDNRQGLDKARV